MILAVKLNGSINEIDVEASLSQAMLCLLSK